jgi:hypothetical protein
MANPSYVKARCLEVNCPHFGWVKVNFSDLDFYYWDDNEDGDRGLEITFKCVCGEEHEIDLW